MSAEEVTFVSVPVPQQYVTKVYELIAQLDSHGNSKPARTTPSVPVTKEMAVRMYRESDGPHRRLMTYLAEHPGSWHTTTEVAEALGLKHGAKSLAGSLGAFSRRSENRYGGQKPWESRDIEEGGQVEHMMDPKVAGWILEVPR